MLATPLPVAAEPSTLIVATIAIVVVAACVFQASIGFGANLIAQPIVFQFEPDLVPGPIMMATTFLSVLVLARDRQSVEIGPIGVTVVGAVLGIAIGIIVIGLVSEASLAIVIALCVLAMVLVTAVGAGPTPSGRNLFFAGTFGGFGSTTSGIGGPPVAILFAGAEGGRTRGFLSGYFLIASSLTFAGLALAGRFGVDQLLDGLLLLPAAGIGFLLSGPLLPVVDRRGTRGAILTVSAGAAIVLLARTLLG